MNKTVWLSATGLAVAVGMLAVGYRRRPPSRRRRPSDAQTAVTVASAGPTVDRVEVENIIRDYLVKNPELLIDMQQALEIEAARGAAPRQSRRDRGFQRRHLQCRL